MVMMSIYHQQLRAAVAAGAADSWDSKLYTHAKEREGREKEKE